MAKSFVRPALDNIIEKFTNEPFFHAPSQRYYDMQRKNGGLIFKRYQLDDKKRPINVFEHKVDYILGSGHKTRSYLYQTAVGELFQLPIGWYTQEQRWGMAPGYDNKAHSGVLRPVQRECMFCHNALPNVPKGSDLHWQPHTFPQQLPQGTGCQRCHGPGGAHLQTVMQGAGNIEEIRASIVNPARLEPQKRDAVCFQCHLLPSVSMIGVRKFDRADYSFRPGQVITDYLVHVDVDDANIRREDRFEINHHAYRLRQSACFAKSDGALTCINCHNPHRKVPIDERVSHYGAVCQSCHSGTHKPLPEKSAIDPKDCIACHMPQRRTQDVVHVTMTDHKIGHHTVDDLLAPLKESEPILEGIDLLMPDKSLTGDLTEIYKVITLMRSSPLPNYVDYLQKMLAKTKLKESQPYFDLARGHLATQRYKDAEETSRFLLKEHPDNFRAKQWLGTSLLGQGKLDEAELLFSQLEKERPDVAEIHFNFALLLKRKNQYGQALKRVEQAITARPNLVSAWFYRANLSFKLGKNEDAIAHYRRALEIDPSYTRAYLGLAQALLKKGDRDEAKRYLKHGVKMARQPKAVANALATLRD